MQNKVTRKKLILSLVTVLAIATMSLSAKDVYATVDGENITKQDIAIALRNQQANFDTLPKETQKIIINKLVEQKILTKMALKSDVEKKPSYKDALEKFKKDLALEIWMQEEFQKVSVTDKEVSDFFAKNKEKFISQEKLNARHILMKTEDEAKDIIKTLDASKNKLEKFIELAKTKSTGPMGKNGGSLGEFAVNEMVPEFSQAASALSKGSYSKTPVKTQFGYHIIYLEDKILSKKLNFDEVKVRIKQRITQERFKNNINEIVAKLKEKAQIVIK